MSDDFISWQAWRFLRPSSFYLKLSWSLSCRGSDSTLERWTGVWRAKPQVKEWRWRWDETTPGSLWCHSHCVNQVSTVMVPKKLEWSAHVLHDVPVTNNKQACLNVLMLFAPLDAVLSWRVIVGYLDVQDLQMYKTQSVQLKQATKRVYPTTFTVTRLCVCVCVRMCVCAYVCVWMLVCYSLAVHRREHRTSMKLHL